VADEEIVTRAGKLKTTVSIGLAASDPEHDAIERIIGAAERR
jgi:PleD family two-component response regulator